MYLEGEQMAARPMQLSMALEIVAIGSRHKIHHDRAELVEREVARFVEQIRGTGPPPADYGSTISE